MRGSPAELSSVGACEPVERREVALVALIAGGGLAWWLSQAQDGGGVYAPVNLDYTGVDPGGGSGDFLSRLSAAEDPTGNPYAKNPRSSASGSYQFTKATWTALGGDWGDDPTQAFGGLQPSPEEQTARAQMLTAGNASVLSRAGLAVDNLTLYAAHIFGPGRAARVLAADPATSLASLVGASTAAKNPALGKTVSSFTSYLERKVGG